VIIHLHMMCSVEKIGLNEKNWTNFPPLT